MTKRALTFPGQGSQAVGMGRELAEAYPAAREVFETVEGALSQSLSQLMFEGPEDELRLTENAQPALMAVSMAVIRVLEAEGVKVAECASYVAGHSLGEYSALCAAGAFDLADTARVLRVRGKAMQEAVPVGEGAMAAILGLDLDAVEEVAGAAAQGETCELANDNAPGQVVISGSASAVQRAIDIAKARGARRALPLPVSAPFHCSLMGPAAEAMEEALSDMSISAPVVPVIANVTAGPVSDPDEIRRRLVEQVTGRVRWSECVGWLAGDGEVTDLIEVGSGKVLTGLARRIAPEANAFALNTPDDIVGFLASLNG